MTQVVELIEFKSIKVGDIVRCSRTAAKYGSTILIESGSRMAESIFLFSDSSFFVRHKKSGTLYFGIAND